jgi:rhodanese-related sulfurtransferase
MKKITLIVFALLLSFCSFAQIKVLTVNEFEKQIKATKNLQLIDVRTPQEFEKNHIKGAINIDVRNQEFRTEIEKLDKTKPVFVYCIKGIRSKSACYIFNEAGFKTIYHFEGGLNAWIEAKKEVVSN